jgi:hypothetical protein
MRRGDKDGHQATCQIIALLSVTLTVRRCPVLVHASQRANNIITDDIQRRYGVVCRAGASSASRRSLIASDITRAIGPRRGIGTSLSRTLARYPFVS